MPVSGLMISTFFLTVVAAVAVAVLAALSVLRVLAAVLWVVVVVVVVWVIWTGDCWGEKEDDLYGLNLLLD